MVYLGNGRDSAASVAFYDPNDESQSLCLFRNVAVGQELVCDGISSSTTTITMEDRRGRICEGYFDTSCRRSNILNTVNQGCDRMQSIVTGWTGNEGGVCDDGYEPCDCASSTRSRYASVIEKQAGYVETSYMSTSNSFYVFVTQSHAICECIRFENFNIWSK